MNCSTVKQWTHIRGRYWLDSHDNFNTGLLMRPEKDEAKAEAETRKCEAEAKNFLWGRGQNIWGQGRGHSV